MLRTNSKSLLVGKFGLLLGFCLLPSCFLFPKDRHLLTSPNLKTPSLTFRTFAVALRNNAPELEYKCLSEEFKEQYENLTLQRYIIARAKILQDHPEITWVGRMSIDQEGVNLDTGVGFVAASLLGSKLVVRMQREYYVRVWLKDDTYRDYAIDSLESLVRVQSPTLWSFQLEDPILRGVKLEEVDEIELSYEWKILSFETPAES